MENAQKNQKIIIITLMLFPLLIQFFQYVKNAYFLTREQKLFLAEQKDYKFNDNVRKNRHLVMPYLQENESYFAYYREIPVNMVVFNKYVRDLEKYHYCTASINQRCKHNTGNLIKLTKRALLEELGLPHYQYHVVFTKDVDTVISELVHPNSESLLVYSGKESKIQKVISKHRQINASIMELPSYIYDIMEVPEESYYEKDQLHGLIPYIGDLMYIYYYYEDTGYLLDPALFKHYYGIEVNDLIKNQDWCYIVDISSGYYLANGVNDASMIIVDFQYVFGIFADISAVIIKAYNVKECFANPPAEAIQTQYWRQLLFINKSLKKQFYKVDTRNHLRTLIHRAFNITSKCNKQLSFPFFKMHGSPKYAHGNLILFQLHNKQGTQIDSWHVVEKAVENGFDIAQPISLRAQNCTTQNDCPNETWIQVALSQYNSLQEIDKMFEFLTSWFKDYHD